MSDTPNPVKRVLSNIAKLYADASAGWPHVVHCTRCGALQDVDPAACLRSGWPKCCGLTMHLGSGAD